MKKNSRKLSGSLLMMPIMSRNNDKNNYCCPVKIN